MSKIKKALEKAKIESEKEQETFARKEEQAVEEAIFLKRPAKVLEKVIEPEEKALETLPEFEPPPKPLQSEPGKKEQPVRKEISPSYQKTRVINIDEKLLKRHKIVALFHEEEMSDQIKILSTQILQKMDDMGGNTLLITSSKPYEGKTFTAINLALSICLKVDRTVLLVDADLRKPDIHRYLGIDTAEGLSDYLLYQAEIPNLLINPGIQKLTFLPGGKALPNSTELLALQRHLSTLLLYMYIFYLK